MEIKGPVAVLAGFAFISHMGACPGRARLAGHGEVSAAGWYESDAGIIWMALILLQVLHSVDAIRIVSGCHPLLHQDMYTACLHHRDNSGGDDWLDLANPH